MQLLPAQMLGPGFCLLWESWFQICEARAILTSKLRYPWYPAWGEAPHVGKAAVFPSMDGNTVPGQLGDKKQ